MGLSFLFLLLYGVLYCQGRTLILPGIANFVGWPGSVSKFDDDESLDNLNVYPVAPKEKGRCYMIHNEDCRNAVRSSWVDSALEMFCSETGQSIEDDGYCEVLTDFLADMKLWSRLRPEPPVGSFNEESAAGRIEIIVSNKIENRKEFKTVMEKKKYNIFTQKYSNMCRFNVPKNIRDELYQVEWLFRNIVGILVTLDEEALIDDPERKWQGLSRAEGGLVFKHAAVVFESNSVTFKDTVIPLKKQNPVYNIIVANTIDALCKEYSLTEGSDTKEKLLKASTILLGNRMPIKEFMREIEETFFVGNSWRGFFGDHPEDLKLPTLFN